MKSTSDIRRSFLEFFEQRDHRIVPSGSLVPGNDPSLLFTNAGMVPFKDVFLGAEKRSYRRATTSQRCVRAGGKHNDLDQVGYTARHHTFFEMLGNFSFGDYFKRQAIEYAWEFLTRVAGLPPERLWVTVFEDDDEAADIWLNQIGVDPARFSRIGAKDNFWAMGDTGPCGPCSEIFYDHGPEVPGGPPGSAEEDGDRYIEIWNLVFMQFDRDGAGEMKPLPKPCVDTGMGLERLAAVLQGVHSNYQIDLFQALIKRAAELTGCADHEHPSLKVIADHIRACGFLIIDGVLPSNEGRGYVLRRIIRRAVRHGYKLGCSKPFFHAMVSTLTEQMGEAYPELQEKGAFAADILRNEEERFFETLSQGMRLLEETIDGLDGTVIPGDTVFKLYDTFGFPADLTADVARERNLEIDQAGFEAAMTVQRERARAAGGFASSEHVESELLSRLPETEFLGHDCSESEATVLALLVGGKPVDRLEAGEAGMLILDRTPFYAESGGQIGDIGRIESRSGTFAVTDTQKLAGSYHAHRGKVISGEFAVGDSVETAIDCARREAIVRNHSATHLLHAALREVLGEHVEQKGSLVADDRLRFDFSHFQAVEPEQLQRVEDRVNEQIRRNVPAESELLSFDEAIAGGAMALFGEKYGERVRVMRFGDFSVELCGGTHVERVGDIGLFSIVGETGIAAGVRRIEAVTGKGALELMRAQQARLGSAARLLRTSPEDVPEKVEQVLNRNRALERELERIKQKLASSAGDALLDAAQTVGSAQIVVANVVDAEPKSLRETVDKLKDKLKSAAVVLATVSGDRVHLVAGVTRDLTRTIKAGDLVNVAAAKVEGRGGGRPDMAQAGGTRIEGLDDALQAAREWLQAKLSG